MIELVTALSDHISDGLAAAGYPRLTPRINGMPGRIFIGDKHEFEQQMPPRIIWRPTKSNFSARDTTRGTANVSTNRTGYSPESRSVVSQRSIATEEASFEVSCWSIAPDGLPDTGASDWEYTRALYLQFLASAQHLMAGCYAVSSGIWRPVPHVQRVGREFVFPMVINLPVLAELEPTSQAPAGAVAGLPFAPAGTEALISDTMVGPTGLTGPGCE